MGLANWRPRKQEGRLLTDGGLRGGAEWRGMVTPVIIMRSGASRVNSHPDTAKYPEGVTMYQARRSSCAKVRSSWKEVPASPVSP